MKNKLKPRYKYVFLLVWMLVIFSFSSEVRTVSHARSEAIVSVVTRTLHVKASNDLVDFITRKSAHTFLYLILGILMFNVVKDYNGSGNGDRTKDLRLAVLLSILLCMAYANSDEFHQMFTPGRGSLVSDVMIDTAASSIGAGGYWLVARQREKRQNIPS
jgi:VanZ family protein